jgi:hypothetical protein
MQIPKVAIIIIIIIIIKLQGQGHEGNIKVPLECGFFFQKEHTYESPIKYQSRGMANVKVFKA